MGVSKRKKTWREVQDSKVGTCDSCGGRTYDGRCPRCSGDAGL